MLMDDYLNLLNDVITKQQQQQQTSAPPAAQPTCRSASSKESTAALRSLQAFRDSVVPAWHEASISRRQLLRLLSQSEQDRVQHMQSIRNHAGHADSIHHTHASGSSSSSSRLSEASDADISHLLSAELLSRDPVQDGHYTFTVPGAGAVVKSVINGRKELINLITKKR